MHQVYFPSSLCKPHYYRRGKHHRAVQSELLTAQLLTFPRIESPRVPGARRSGPQSRRAGLGAWSALRAHPNLPAAAAAPAAQLRPHEVIPRPGSERHIPRQPRGERDLSRQRGREPSDCARPLPPIGVLGLFSIDAFYRTGVAGL